eukprot:g13274.t1
MLFFVAAAACLQLQVASGEQLTFNSYGVDGQSGGASMWAVLELLQIGDGKAVIELSGFKSSAGPASDVKVVVIPVSEMQTKVSTDHFCCSTEDVAGGKCAKANSLVYENDKTRKGLVFAADGPKSQAQSIPTTAGSSFYLTVASCSPPADGSLRISGTVLIRHPHGYLSAGGVTLIGLFFLFAVAFLGLMFHLLCRYSKWPSCHRAVFGIAVLSVLTNTAMAGLLHTNNASGMWPEVIPGLVGKGFLAPVLPTSTSTATALTGSGTSPSGSGTGIPTREYFNAARSALLFLTSILFMRGLGYSLGVNPVAALTSGADAAASSPSKIAAKEKLYCAAAAVAFFFWRLYAVGGKPSSGLTGLTYGTGEFAAIPGAGGDVSATELASHPTVAMLLSVVLSPGFVCEVAVVLSLAYFVDTTMRKTNFLIDQLQNDAEGLADVLKQYVSAWTSILYAVCGAFAVYFLMDIMLAATVEAPSALGMLFEQYTVVCAEIGEDVVILLGCLIIVVLIPEDVQFAKLPPSQEEDIEMVDAGYEEEARDITVIGESRVWEEERFDDDEDVPRRLE